MFYKFRLYGDCYCCNRSKRLLCWNWQWSFLQWRDLLQSVHRYYTVIGGDIVILTLNLILQYMVFLGLHIAFQRVADWILFFNSMWREQHSLVVLLLSLASLQLLQMALLVRLCAHLCRKAKQRYILFCLKVIRTLKGCSLSVSLTMQKSICSLPKMQLVMEYDDRVLLSFIPDNLGLITGLQAFGEYIRDTATVNINDSDSKRCSLCLALSFRHAALGSQCRSFVIVVGATNSLMIARRWGSDLPRVLLRRPTTPMREFRATVAAIDVCACAKLGTGHVHLRKIVPAVHTKRRAFPYRTWF